MGLSGCGRKREDAKRTGGGFARRSKPDCGASARGGSQLGLLSSLESWRVSRQTIDSQLRTRKDKGNPTVQLKLGIAMAGERCRRNAISAQCSECQ